MLESTLAFVRMEKEVKARMNLVIPQSLKDCVEELAKSEETSASNIICGALRVVCEEWKLGGCDIITKEKADLYKMLYAKEEELLEFLADPENDDGYEYRGYYFSNDLNMNKQTTDIALDQIEQLKKALGIKDERIQYKGDI